MRVRSAHGIEQDVAVKLLNVGLDARSSPVSRMRDEGRLLAGLNHPAILQVMDFCNLDGRIGLVTEYVPGADLDDCIHGEDPIPPRAAMQVAGQVADALHAAFESKTTDGGRLGLVHRDVKPANIRVTPHGSVKLLDFGIAKSADLQRETSTQQKVAFGTPAYMAPEVLSYEILEALPSRDVFALGATLFEALVRERFFHGLDQPSIGRVCNKEERFRDWRLERLARLRGQDPEVVSLVGRMLSYHHTERPSAREVAEQCLAIADRLSGASLWSWARTRKWPVAALQSGPWTGRSLIDTHIDPTVDDSARQVDTGGIASVLATGDGHFVLPGAPPEAQPQAFAMAQPRARAPEPKAARGPRPPVEPPAAPAPAAPTAVTSAPNASLQIAFIATLVVVGTLVGALAVLLARPDLVLGERAARDPIARAARRSAAQAEGAAPAADTGEPVPAQGGAGSTAYAFGATPSLGSGEVSTVMLQTEGDVLVTRSGRRPAQIPPRGYIRVEPGPVEVMARFGGQARYERQFSVVLAAGETVTVVCDGGLQRCQVD